MKELTISMRSHHFVVSNITARSRNCVLNFARRQVQYGFARSRNSVRPALKTFAASTADRSEFRFHINHWKEFQEEMMFSRLSENLIEIVYEQIHEPLLVDLPLKPDSFLPRDDQPLAIEYLAKPPPPRSKCVIKPPGTGKAQPLDAAIKIPGGWSTMGEMSVGTRVIARDGSVTSVTDVYPQGEKDIYQITFFDGRKAECCAEHLWRIYNRDYGKSGWKVMSTTDVMDKMELTASSRDSSLRCYIELIKPEDNGLVELPIPPYTLGVLLGDAHFGNHSIILTTPDRFIIDEVTKELPESMRISDHATRDMSFGFVRTDRCKGLNYYLTALRGLELCSKRSHEKFVPELYLNGSKDQRWALLQGLMDTDGTADKSGSSSFCSSSLALAEAVTYLVRSLGGIASMTIRNSSYTYNGEKKPGRVAYQINIRHQYPSRLFRLPKKKERVNDQNQYSPNLKLRIEKIEFIGRKEAQCISIDHPDQLYITNDFTVTHNTFIALNAMSHVGHRAVGIMKPQFLENWLEGAMKTLDIELEDMVVINGSKQLIALLNLAIENRLPQKIILISNKTMQNYISLYEAHKEAIIDMGYPCYPDQMLEVLQAGIRFIDEVHMDFHLNFKLDLYTNIRQTNVFTATFLSDDPKVKQMMELAYPTRERYIGPAIVPYVRTRAIFYAFREPDKIKCRIPGNTAYNHNAFEESVLKNDRIMAGYFELIETMVKREFLDPDFYKPGDKGILFCSSIAMCTALQDYLQKKFPNLDVRRKVADDDREELREGDLVISTLGSGGTGHDIPMLTWVGLTTNVRSSSGNIQGHGRLRELRAIEISPGMFLEAREPRFTYLVNEDNLKHVEYHEAKKELILPLSTTYKIEYYSTVI